MSVLDHPLARARGHGSAHRGVHHWLAQRASAVLLVLLLPWAVYALFAVAGAGPAEAAAFVARPWNATLLILLLLTVLYHGMLGLQVVIEDYVHHRALEFSLHFLVRAASVTGMVLGIIQVLRITLGGQGLSA